MKTLLLFLMPVLLLCSCNIIVGERVDGNGDITADNRNPGHFNSVSSSGSLDIVLTQSNDFSVQVQGDKNLLPYVLTEVEGNTLKIKTKQGYNLHPSKHMEVHVSAPVFNSISSDGSGNIFSDNTLTNDDKIEFHLSGSGNIEAKVDAGSIESHTSGSGDVSFSGNAHDAEMSVSGSGDIHCFALTSENTKVTINGSGNADVYATKRLDLTVNGSGDVAYKGAASVNSHINGSGSVSKAD